MLKPYWYSKYIYLSPVFDNKVFWNFQQEIVERIKGTTYYTLVADETEDLSSCIILVICMWVVDNDFKVKEDFNGVHPIYNTKT